MRNNTLPHVASCTHLFISDELTTKQIYTTELIEGLPVDQCENLDQETRNRICFLMLDLFFRELLEFQFMQTDPNWANFLYNTETKQVGRSP